MGTAVGAGRHARVLHGQHAAARVAGLEAHLRPAGGAPARGARDGRLARLGRRAALTPRPPP